MQITMACLKPKIDENVRNVGRSNVAHDKAVETFISGLTITHLLVETSNPSYDRFTDDEYIKISTCLSTVHLSRCSVEERSIEALIKREFSMETLRLVLLQDGNISRSFLVKMKCVMFQEGKVTFSNFLNVIKLSAYLYRKVFWRSTPTRVYSLSNTAALAVEMTYA